MHSVYDLESIDPNFDAFGGRIRGNVISCVSCYNVTTNSLFHQGNLQIHRNRYQSTPSGTLNAFLKENFRKNESGKKLKISFFLSTTPPNPFVCVSHSLGQDNCRRNERAKSTLVGGWLGVID